MPKRLNILNLILCSSQKGKYQMHTNYLYHHLTTLQISQTDNPQLKHSKHLNMKDGYISKVINTKLGISVGLYSKDPIYFISRVPR